MRIFVDENFFPRDPPNEVFNFWTKLTEETFFDNMVQQGKHKKKFVLGLNWPNLIIFFGDPLDDFFFEGGTLQTIFSLHHIPPPQMINGCTLMFDVSVVIEPIFHVFLWLNWVGWVILTSKIQNIETYRRIQLPNWYRMREQVYILHICKARCRLGCENSIFIFLSSDSRLNCYSLDYFKKKRMNAM